MHRGYQSNYLVVSGESLDEVMSERNIDREYLKSKLELSDNEFEGLFDGRTVYTLGICDVIAEVTETPKSFWINLDRNYWDDKKRLGM